MSKRTNALIHSNAQSFHQSKHLIENRIWVIDAFDFPPRCVAIVVCVLLLLHFVPNTCSYPPSGLGWLVGSACGIGLGPSTGGKDH
jgi:hypothetical protein